MYNNKLAEEFNDDKWWLCEMKRSEWMKNYEVSDKVPVNSTDTICQRSAYPFKDYKTSYYVYLAFALYCCYLPEGDISNVPDGQDGQVSTILAVVLPLSPEMKTMWLQCGFVFGFGPMSYF